MNKTYQIKDVSFCRCQEYSPYSSKADALGMKTFWRADYWGEAIAYGDTKAECKKEAGIQLSILRNRVK